MAAPIDLNLVRAFAAVRETGSFSAAGARLRVPRSTVSRAVASLENALGARIFHRTTRTVSLTTAGHALYERVAPSLGALERALVDAADQQAEPSGVLRITSTVDLGTMLLAEAVARYTALYPAAQVDVLLTNRVVDLAKEGVDLALRGLVRPPRDSSLVARRVGVLEVALYASPSYIARRGTVRTLADLASHDWITLRGTQVLPTFGAARSAPTAPRVVADEMGFLRQLLREGAGIGPLPGFLGEPELASGSLVRVLPRWVASSKRLGLRRPAGSLSRQNWPALARSAPTDSVPRRQRACRASRAELQ